MATGGEYDLERLAKLTKERRAELGLALNDSNAQAGGIAKATWRRVESGMPVRLTNYVKIDGLLSWAPGSCVAVAEGGAPIPISDVEGEPGASVAEVPPEFVEAELRDTVQLALLATSKGATVEEIRAMSERVVSDLRARGLV